MSATVTQAEIEEIAKQNDSYVGCSRKEVRKLLRAIAGRDGCIIALEARIECADIPMIDECDIKEWHYIAEQRNAECEGVREDLANYRASAEEQIEKLRAELDDLHKLDDERLAEIVRLDRELARIIAVRDALGVNCQ